jgi:hypothetical protein
MGAQEERRGEDGEEEKFLVFVPKFVRRFVFCLLLVVSVVRLFISSLPPLPPTPLASRPFRSLPVVIVQKDYSALLPADRKKREGAQ